MARFHVMYVSWSMGDSDSAPRSRRRTWQEMQDANDSQLDSLCDFSEPEFSNDGNGDDDIGKGQGKDKGKGDKKEPAQFNDNDIRKGQSKDKGKGDKESEKLGKGQQQKD